MANAGAAHIRDMVDSSLQASRPPDNQGIPDGSAATLGLLMAPSVVMDKEQTPDSPGVQEATSPFQPRHPGPTDAPVDATDTPVPPAIPAQSPRWIARG